MALTKKQEIFAQEVVKQPTLSAAYRIAYDTSNWTDESVNVQASKEMTNPKIVLRVNELKQELQNKFIYTLEQSIKRDLNLIERYEAALDVLENKDANAKDVEVAERLIKHIGATAYNSAQDRISKQSGFYSPTKVDHTGNIAGAVTVLTRNYQKSDED